MKKQKQPKKKGKAFRIYSIIFLILAICFFLMTLAGLLGGAPILGIIMLLFGLFSFYAHRVMKKDSKINDHITEQEAAVAEIKESLKTFGTAEIVFPDGHKERRKTYESISPHEGCLISEGGRTYHTQVGCFEEWLPEYRAKFTNWQLISISDAEYRGLRKCKFCAAADRY